MTRVRAHMSLQARQKKIPKIRTWDASGPKACMTTLSAKHQANSPKALSVRILCVAFMAETVFFTLFATRLHNAVASFLHGSRVRGCLSPDCLQGQPAADTSSGRSDGAILWNPVSGQ